jgi:hypothetical protein
MPSRRDLLSSLLLVLGIATGGVLGTIAPPSQQAAAQDGQFSTIRAERIELTQPGSRCAALFEATEGGARLRMRGGLPDAAGEGWALELSVGINGDACITLSDPRKIGSAGAEIRLELNNNPKKARIRMTNWKGESRLEISD